MPQPPKSNSRSQILACLTVGVLLLPFLMLAVHPQVPIYVGFLLAVIVGVPLLIWGLRAQERGQLSDFSEPKVQASNLPTAEDGYTLLAWITCFALLILPIVLIGLGLFWIPAGDQWPLVIARLLYLLSTIGLAYLWWRRLRGCFAADFKLVFLQNDLETIHKFLNEASQVPTRKESLINCLSWLVVTGLAFAIATNIVDLSEDYMKNAPKRMRGLAVLIDWCRGNPNFTRSSLGIVTVIGVVMSAIRFRELRSPSNAENV